MSTSMMDLYIHATGNDVDYGSGTYIVTIPAGAANKTFEIKINNDDILEGNETFALAINISSLPNCITLANPNETTVIILEDDGNVATCHMYLCPFVCCIRYFTIYL